MKNERKQFFLNIRYIRECEELSQEAMADRLHISTEVLRELEEGHLTEEVTVEILCHIEEQFGIHPARLFTPFYRTVWEL